MSQGLSCILGENVQKGSFSDSYGRWIVMLNQKLRNSAKIKRTLKIILHACSFILFSQWENDTFQLFSILQMYALERTCSYCYDSTNFIMLIFFFSQTFHLWAAIVGVNCKTADEHCCFSPKNQSLHGLHPKQHGHQSKEGDSALLFPSHETPLGALHPALSSSEQEEHRHVSPEEGYQDDHKNQTPLL